MKRIKYSILRKITVGVYLLTAVFFALYLIRLGKTEINKAEEYTSKEKYYVESLITCRNALNNLEVSLNTFLLKKDAGSASKVIKNIAHLRAQCARMIKTEKKSVSRDFLPKSDLLRDMATLLSAAYSADYNIQKTASDSHILLHDDCNTIILLTKSVAAELQERLNVELNHVENWQRRSLFFFERLEVTLVTFFIAATLFTFAAYGLSGMVLRFYLEKLSFGAANISSGTLEYRFNDTTNDVVGKVMRDFDTMAEKLEAQTRALELMNRELAEKAAVLEEANLHKDKFLANMSHELRTPLNAVIGFSELMIERSQKLNPEKVKQFSEKIYSAAEHLLALISDLLEIAKVDAGVLKPNFKDIDINKTAESVLIMLQPIADKKGLQMTLNTDNNTPAIIQADERLIRQVLINIINNALKYTKEGTVDILIKNNRGGVNIEVTDTGIGISEKDKILIFKDFHRAEQGLTSNYEGVGLGLTLSKRIVELHGGEITVQSELHMGSTFKIFLPGKEQGETYEKK